MLVVSCGEKQRDSVAKSEKALPTINESTVPATNPPQIRPLTKEMQKIYKGVKPKEKQNLEEDKVEFNAILISPDSTYSYSELIGRVYKNPEPPNNIRFNGGGFSGREYSLEHDSREPIDRVEDTTYLNLFLNKEVYHDENRTVYKKIINIFSLPAMMPGESLIVGPWAGVQHPDKSTRNIVGVGRGDDRGFVQHLRLAWTVDLESGEFVSTSPEQLTAQFEGY